MKSIEAGSSHAVDFALNAHMRGGLDLQVPPLFVVVEFSR
jgi:hypothetical protein